MASHIFNLSHHLHILCMQTCTPHTHTHTHSLCIYYSKTKTNKIYIYLNFIKKYQTIIFWEFFTWCYINKSHSCCCVSQLIHFDYWEIFIGGLLSQFIHKIFAVVIVLLWTFQYVPPMVLKQKCILLINLEWNC